MSQETKLANNVVHARKIINAAENDLGELSRGECVDLLCDNTSWSWDDCDAAVTVIKGPRKRSTTAGID